MSESDFQMPIQDGWIPWFCNLQEHEFFCQIDVEYIQDPFSHFGLKSLFQNYNEATEMILSDQNPTEQDLEDEIFLQVYQEAVELYGMLHQRFILTPKGLALMREWYLNGIFGTCPRVLCGQQKLMPVGLSEQMKQVRVKMYCPKCQDVYIPKKKCGDVDGAYFGCSFPHILMQQYPELCVKDEVVKYVPKIYGFKVEQFKNYREE